MVCNAFLCVLRHDQLPGAFLRLFLKTILSLMFTLKPNSCYQSIGDGLIPVSFLPAANIGFLLTWGDTRPLMRFKIIVALHTCSFD